MSKATSEINEDLSAECTQTFNLKWTIKCFWNLGIPTGESIKSPIFGGTWYLALYPNGVNEAHKDYVSLYLGSESCQNNFEVCTDISLDLSISTPYSTFGANKSWLDLDKRGIENGVPRFYLRSHLYESMLLFNGNLTLKVRFDRKFKDKAIVRNCSKFATDYSDYFNDQSTSDIVITCEEDQREIFHVHKIILGMNSPYFARMFANRDWMENKEGQVVLKDISLDVLKKTLKFLYFGKIEATSNTEFIQDLWEAGDRFGIACLKKQCGVMLSMDNATGICTCDHELWNPL